MTDAIRALREAVEAGLEPSRDEWRAIFPDLPDEDDDYPRNHMAFAANQGWVDAALALMKAVLPGRRVLQFCELWSGEWLVRLEHKHDLPLAASMSDTPARALLHAILKALEAQHLPAALSTARDG
jgi:hypothetical protein